MLAQLAGLGIPLQWPQGEERAAHFLQLVIVVYLCVERLWFLIETHPLVLRLATEWQGNIVINGQGPTCIPTVVLGSSLCPGGQAHGFRTG